MHAKDPYGILKKIFELYSQKGGKFLVENIVSINQISKNETIIKSEKKSYKFEKSQNCPYVNRAINISFEKS